MKLGRIVRHGPDGAMERIVAVDADAGAVVDLREAERTRLERSGATVEAARRIAAAVFPSSMTAAIETGPAFVAAAELALSGADGAERLPWDEVEWATPVDPPVVMDGAAFEQHIVNAHGRGDRPVPDYYYEAPIYYKMNPLTFVGHEADVPYPAYARYLDYELELALVVGRGGSDLRPDEARAHLFGVTIMNDFSARDVQTREMTASFGPAKGKDFATAIGPWITTLDDVTVENLEMTASVNGEEWSRGSTSSLLWSVDEIVAFMSRGELLAPGQLIGTGTVGSGSGLELYRRLQPGDVVEMEVEGIGVLRNRLGHAVGDRWAPEPKQPAGLVPYRPPDR